MARPRHPVLRAATQLRRDDRTGTGAVAGTRPDSPAHGPGAPAFVGGTSVRGQLPAGDDGSLGPRARALRLRDLRGHTVRAGRVGRLCVQCHAGAHCRADDVELRRLAAGRSPRASAALVRGDGLHRHGDADHRPAGVARRDAGTRAGAHGDRRGHCEHVPAAAARLARRRRASRRCASARDGDQRRDRRAARRVPCLDSRTACCAT